MFIFQSRNYQVSGNLISTLHTHDFSHEVLQGPLSVALVRQVESLILCLRSCFLKRRTMVLLPNKNMVGWFSGVHVT